MSSVLQSNASRADIFAGIGRAAALRLAKRGYRIIVADVQSQKGEATAEAISKLVPSGEAAFVKLVSLQFEGVAFVRLLTTV